MVSESLRSALFWMNAYLEMLGVQRQALGRMRRLVAAHSRWPDEYEEDLRLVMTEIERVTDRLSHWEDIVDRLNADALRAC